MNPQRTLVLLLRFMGCVLLLAFGAMLLPESFMAAMHTRLGMGDFPASPLVDYLTRSIAALYGFHGVLILLVSRDMARYGPIVTYLGVMSVVVGIMLIAIDLHAAMPWWWTTVEGPPLMVMGLAILLLSRASYPAQSSP